MIDYDRLKARVFSPVFQEYSRRDTMLYGLGLNLGADPLDAHALRYVAVDPPAAEPMMAMTLARLGPWMRDPDVGIDYRRTMVGEMTLRLHAPLPPEGRVRGDHRVIRITDKGEGRGALVTVLRELRDARTGQLLAEFEQLTFCRGEGGFAKDGRYDPPPEVSDTNPWQTGRPADFEIDLPTSPQQALIYRLSGDMNPLHSDPDAARRAGFDRPVLHGLATMGMAGHAVARALGRPLTSIRGRLSAPVFPGERLRLEGLKVGAFRIVNKEDREVLSNGFYSI
ncbi:MaoC/PaaZ C-terminal domain-containing protein [Shinella sp.]|uniref:MaoC/PaaZ C-terminal domain-containing protein n=1 Tax=Shinella sp. TaxID=1870904 RepID=UPI003F721D7F